MPRDTPLEHLRLLLVEIETEMTSPRSRVHRMDLMDRAWFLLMLHSGLRTYGRRCGVVVTPQQLRHSCATLLLNVSAPILTGQTILGHQRVDTTLGYARLYDGTVAADYYRAMLQIERQLMLPEDASPEPLNSGQLLALVDTLRNGTLNEAQQETVCALRAGIVTLAERGSAS